MSSSHHLATPVRGRQHARTHGINAYQKTAMARDASLGLLQVRWLRPSAVCVCAPGLQVPSCVHAPRCILASCFTVTWQPATASLTLIYQVPASRSRVALPTASLLLLTVHLAAVKLCDFGMSCFIPDTALTSLDNGYGPLKYCLLCSLYCTTTPWQQWRLFLNLVLPTDTLHPNPCRSHTTLAPRPMHGRLACCCGRCERRTVVRSSTSVGIRLTVHVVLSLADIPRGATLL